MSSCLTSDASSAVPITPVTKAALPQWLEAHPDKREWLNVIGSRPSPIRLHFCPLRTTNQRVFSPASAKASRFGAFAALPASLPEGVYSIDAELDDAHATAAALGWSLGSYAFTEVQGAEAGGTGIDLRLQY